MNVTDTPVQYKEILEWSSLRAMATKGMREETEDETLEVVVAFKRGEEYVCVGTDVARIACLFDDPCMLDLAVLIPSSDTPGEVITMFTPVAYFTGVLLEETRKHVIALGRSFVIYDDEENIKAYQAVAKTPINV